MIRNTGVLMPVRNRLVPENCSRYKNRELANLLRDLRSRILDELSGHKFLYVPPSKEEYYSWKFASEGLEDKLERKLLNNLHHAGQCFAVYEYTACVFHLTRAMGQAIKIMASNLDISDIEGDLDILLNEADIKIQTLPKGGNHAEWSKCVTSLRAFRRVWRNPTLHIEDHYSNEATKEIFLAVRVFLRDLATLI